MSYARLQAGFRDITLLQESLGLLMWDSAVMMPHGAADRRGQQMACLDGVAYERLEQMAEILAHDTIDDCPADAWHQANLRGMRKQVQQVLLVPKGVQTRTIEAQTVCEMHWRDARAESDFSLVAESFADLLALRREALQAQAEGLGVSIMDAAIGNFEPELTEQQASSLLEGHAEFIQDFLPEAQECAARRLRDHPQFLQLSLADQEKLCRDLCARMGLDGERSRIDVSTHPFSAGYPSDQRVTVRFEDDDALSSIWAAIHESGHVLYEIQLPQQWNMQPVGQSGGMLLHESQSLTMEMQAARSREFLQWLADYIQQTYAVSFTVDGLLAQSWNVQPTPIRVGGDEVTYPLHILLRFRLEQQMLSGALSVRDLPEAFRMGQKELLGLDITDDAEGCLQDIHWYDGSFGYFPCYALGAMAAAQLFAAARADDPEILPALAQGDFSRVRDWMGVHVHQKASSVLPNSILQQATGAPLNASALQHHLRGRYGV